ncbi:uncharacterized protein N7500_005348 [Penicillium coprophilum]|uniref:uncharacterized protein n=1 Tax=Penicillium coprophilum TaxID=36646 RepID=UPI002394B63E|nr:uncharacterized protein N7500_005348 [Penicillium coprophilum]KAJ5163518.1 hypothetical protein N7500_005348 [Penicillium coprophilum]
MKRNSEPAKCMNGTKDLHESAETTIPSPPRLLPRSSTEEYPTSHSIVSSSRDRIPPSELDRLPTSPSVSTSLPPLPAAWEGTEDMKIWLHAKIEEDRHKQQEEMTQQANLMLEKRRIEQSMLSDALRTGIPPKLVPLIFNGIYTTGADELQRQLSVSDFRPATPSVVPQKPNQDPTPPKRPSVGTKSPQQTPQRAPKQPSRARICELSPTATSYLPETRHSRRSIDLSDRHRERMISSERERLRRKMKSQNLTDADKDLLDTAFEHTFPVTESMIQDHSPQIMLDRPGLASETSEEQQPALQEAHPKSFQESAQQQPRSQPQLQLRIPSNPVGNSNAPFHLHPGQTNSPSPKRKDQRSHKKVPPPQFRRKETVLGQRDPFYESQLDRKEQHHDLSNTDESTTCEGGSSG